MKWWKWLALLLIITGRVVLVLRLRRKTDVLEERVKFGVMADIHMDWTDWKYFLGTAKKRGDEFVIIAGDMTSLGKKSELIKAKAVLDEAGLKYYVIPGNHDLWESSKLKESIFNEVFGNDYQSFKVGKVKFILVNNGGVAGLGEEQIKWLWGEVGECREWKCVVVLHMPIDNSFSTHMMGEGNTEVGNEAVNLRKLFKDNGVVDLITGHLHYSTAYESDGLRTTIVGAISRERNTQRPRYTEFIMRNKILNKEVVLEEDVIN